MKIERFFTASIAGTNGTVYDMFEWQTVDAVVAKYDGTVVFEMKGVEAPKSWSQSAINIAASKYFRKAGVPGSRGHEHSLRQVIHRIVKAWTEWGASNSYFDTPSDRDAFYDEVAYTMLAQICAPNSPQWFNTGIALYDPPQKASEQFAFSPDGTIVCPELAYTRPQLSACFIQSVDDKLIGDGGIMDLVGKEALLFKYGSGTGTNFSPLRAAGEKLSAGGSSSGLMSWLKISDAAAGAVKSGGTSRRAAKMVVLDADHPDIFTFVRWKAREELKVRAMTEGWPAVTGQARPDVSEFIARAGLALDDSYEGEAYTTVSGQNANNSVRFTDEFFDRLANLKDWSLFNRVDGKAVRTGPAQSLWDEINYCAWACADPGLQFHTTINFWNTCIRDGEIRATNPCGEYMWLDNTACNLASINLVHAVGPCLTSAFNVDVNRFSHIVRLWTVVLDISVGLASYPSEAIARGSYQYRTLGLGYANLGALLMRRGLAYASPEGRELAAVLTSLMSATSWETSAAMAKELGAFPACKRNEDSVVRVLQQHAAWAAGHLSSTDHWPKAAGETRLREIYDAHRQRSKLSATQTIWNVVCDVWNRAVDRVAAFGARNAQTTLLAPTGTIGFVMDCDTTGVEPDFALVKSKSLAGGGNMQIVNQSVNAALKVLGYDEDTAASILSYVTSKGSVVGCSALNPDHASVFACAVGQDAIPVYGHLTMMAAVQPFLSGAISKTINMPNSATVEDVAQAHMWSWENGLKAVAIYRDGCKLSQPLNQLGTVASEHKTEIERLRAENAKLREAVQTAVASGPHREKLPDTRQSLTHKVEIGNHKAYITVGLYPNGRPGEIFIKMAKEGSTVSGFIDSVAKAWSHSLQNGVSVEALAKKFEGQRFEPNGMTSNRDIPFASSIVDYIAKWLLRTFVEGNSGLIAKKIRDGASVEEVVWAQAQPGGGSVISSVTPSDGYVVDPSAPPCGLCGTIMVRNGSCHKCPNCGGTSGCS